MAKELASSAIVQEVLTRHNYVKWSAFMRNYLLGQDLWDIIENERKPVKNEAKFKAWRTKNAMALHAIQISCGPDLLPLILEPSLAREAWNLLKDMHEEQNVKKLKRSLVRIRKPGRGIDARDRCRDFKPLLEALRLDDWDAINQFLGKNPLLEDVRGKILDSNGSTILHLAVRFGNAEIVEKLVQQVSPEDLEIVDSEGYTALAYAASLGITKMVQCMIKQKSNLACIGDNNGLIPIIRASAKGHKDMVRYLYSVAPFDDSELASLTEINGATFICNCIVNTMFDFALDLLRRQAILAVAPSFEGVSPVFSLSQIPSAFPSGSHLASWQRWIYNRILVKPLPASDSVRINIPKLDEDQPDGENNVISMYGKMRGVLSYLLKIFGIKQIYDTKLIHNQAWELLDLVTGEPMRTLSDHEQYKKASVYKAIFQAVQNGCFEFLVSMLSANLDLAKSTDMNGRNIYLCAVAYRQQTICGLYFFTTNATAREIMASACDRFENNMLHLAAMLPPPGQIDHISGPALQMQKELQWFKAVESIMYPKSREDLNIDGKTPRELFTEQHMDMMKEGERWMKDTATSSTVVAALIVTITFTAAFTVPGGNNDNNGIPKLLEKPLFIVFLVSDAISFFASSSSLLLFLEILTTRYGEEYFLESLPKKMLFGLTTFLLSIATMMIAFCCALSLMLRGQSWWVFIPVILIACVPISLFLFPKFPLLIEIFISTYGPSILENMKHIGDDASSLIKGQPVPNNFNNLCDSCPVVKKCWKQSMNIWRPN